MKLFLPLIFLCLGLAANAQNDLVTDDESSDFNLNKPERVEWLRNTGAGLFVHFNVDAPLGIVISHALVGASDDFVSRYYSELPAIFNPEKFDPKALATLAKLAGMKYIMFTTKHHSGFCFWDTKSTDLNITHTPYKKDLLREYVEATRAAGLGVGFYFSPEDFWFLHQHKIPISRTDVKMDAETREAYNDYTRLQTEELMKNYGKIDLLFIDGDPKEIVKETSWKLQPDILITRGAIKTPEQVLPGARITEPWLSCITMGTAWQYQPTNERYKSGKQLLQLLIEARAKGGSLLLNVGPKPNGELPVEQEDRLREMAAWYFINRECMDSVRSWVVSNEGETWFTAKGKMAYAIVTDAQNWKEGERRSFIFHSVKGTAKTRVNVLGQNSRIIEYKNTDVSCTFKQTPEGLEVSVVKAQRIYDDHRWPNPVVIKLENVEPAIAEAVLVETGSSARKGASATLNGKVFEFDTFKKAGVKKARFYYRPYAGQVETLYAAPWKKTGWVEIGPDGRFSLTTNALGAGQFEYKAVAGQNSLEIEGENKILR